MTISIIIPVLNGAETIRRCLDSIREQSCVDREVVVIDGGSTDDTVRIAREYPEIVKILVSEPDKGQSDAINKGFSRSTGDILCWLCADDTFRPGALPLIAGEFARHPDVDVVSGACRRVYADGGEIIRAVSATSWRRVAYNNEFDQPSMFWTRRLYQEVGPVDTSMHLAMDWDYWNRFKGKMREFRTVADVLSDYYFTDSNKTSGNPAGHLAETRRVVAKYCPFSGMTERLYSYLYNQFDLNGCYDGDGKVNKHLREEHHAFLRFAKTLFDADVVDMYNWNWISRMARGL